MQLLARCRKEGINLTLNQVLRSKSITHLSENLGDSIIVEHLAEQTDKPFGLSPIQQFYFKSIGDEKNSHFNQSYTLRLARRINATTIKNAMDAIVKCHSMLRARFFKDEGGTWLQKIPSDPANAYRFETHDVTSIGKVVDIISNTQQSLNIVDGPVFAVNLFSTPTAEQVVFLTAHHLVIDVVSWRIILGDLEECLSSESIPPLQNALSFQLWCEKQAAHALQSTQIESLKNQQFLVHPTDLSFWALDGRTNLYGDVERDSFSLDKTMSAMALEDHHQVLRTDVVDVFLASIVHSFSRIFINRKTPTIFNETHGREPWDPTYIDPSRTVGWFTTMYPVSVPISEVEDDVVQTIRQVKDCRRKIRDNGREYFAHRYLTADGKQRLAADEPMEILFNYLGKMQQLESVDTLFQPMQFNEDEEGAMSDLGAKTIRPALFEISASVTHDEIHMNFMYNRYMKNQKGIRRWIAECQRTLEEIIKSLAKMEVSQPTLSDFPLLPLESYDRLERVVKTFPKVGILSYDQVEDMYPCASMQEGMILSQIKDPESYWSFSTFEVKSKHGQVDVRKVARAWQKVVNRHPALRTVFVDSVCKGGVFDQIVLKSPDSGVLVYACKDTELTEKLGSIKYSKLNGKKAPRLPHQLAVVQTESGKVIVKLEINHAVIDGGSHAVIRRDLEDAYEGRLPAEEGALYSDYIKYLRTLPAKAAINYWKDQLHDVQPCHFPTAPQHSSKQRELHSLYMDFGRFSELQTLAERSSVTFSNIMLAAWALVLRTYTGSSDICYGYLTSGRNIPIDNIDKAVGAFINMLVSRIKLNHSLPVLEVFQKVQNDFIESLPHQHCSLAQFQHDLGLSGKSLFNTAVSVQNHGAAEATATPESDVEFVHLDAHDPSEFAITVNIDASRNDEGVRFAYWTDCISDATANGISTTMAKILTGILGDSNQTVSELDASIADKPPVAAKAFTPPLASRSLRFTPPVEIPETNSSTAERNITIPTIPKIEVAPETPILPTGAPDWSSFIRSIVSEIVPQIVDQIVAKNKTAFVPAPSTVTDMTNQMAGMLARKASQSLRAGRNLETGSIRSMRSRRLSVASDTESRINIAADMVAAAGMIATETLKSVPPDFVEKKLLTLWSELLDMVEGSIANEDSFFVSLFIRV
jgi:non-ribosomal peptide synthase protein (TIGR01720 family)